MNYNNGSSIINYLDALWLEDNLHTARHAAGDNCDNPVHSPHCVSTILYDAVKLTCMPYCKTEHSMVSMKYLIGSQR
jgi:hypothetical protein